MSYTSPRRRSLGSVAALLTTAVSLAIALALLMNRQAIVDQMSIWQYQPSGQVQSFVTRSGMNDTGKRYLYASQPSLENRQTFNGNCTNEDKNTAILGCYVNQRIHIYNVDNEKLDGIRSVTAAHEMLHAAYERMSDSERKRVNLLVEAEYKKLQGDGKLAKRMAFYAKTEPAERDNELHSIIATEVASIAPELEEYYRTYFSDRQKVVALHASYEAVFTQLQKQADELTARLNALQSEIENGRDGYNADVKRLNADIQTFNTRAEKGNFDNQAQFDAERAQLISRANELDRTRSQLNADITEYDRLQKELAAIASQSDELNRSINSSLAPAPSL